MVKPLLYGIGRVYKNIRHRVNPYVAVVKTLGGTIQRTFPTETDAVEWIRQLSIGYAV